jgi:UDP-N-acetylmuramate-alanine ligase
MTFDLTAPRSVHVLGASGPGMGAIARILARMGHRVSGCDVRGVDR